MKLFDWLDSNRKTPGGKFANQLLPIIVCFTMLVLFMGLSYFFIQAFINPVSSEDILIVFDPKAVAVGFFLYFVTAVDYALIVGRMQVTNPGSRARFIMNVFTCLGCFAGVTIVLFLWGFAKEIPVLILIILLFAGSVMIKLAYEGIEYFEQAAQIPAIIRKVTVRALTVAYYFTKIFTSWIPELGSPRAEKMSLSSLAKWSFFLPFIIGLDDLVGYLGAMTIYNAFGLLFGIYLADILIDLLIFVSPNITKRLVESPILSLIAAYAFIYLAYKSYSEAHDLLHENFHIDNVVLIIGLVVLLALISLFHQLRKQPSA